MKSAWMLMVVVGVVIPSISGCMQPNWGISPPAGWSQAPDSAQQSAPASESPAAPSTPPQGAPAQATADDGQAADENDPVVAELTRKIEALSSRDPATAAPGDGQSGVSVPQQVVSSAAPTAGNPQPAAANPAPTPQAGPATAASVGSAPLNPPAAPAALPVAAAPAASQPAPAAVSPPAPQPAPGKPAVANVPTSMLITGEPVAVESAASPTPRPMPLVQPSPSSAQPTASPAVTVAITDVRPATPPPASDADSALATANQPSQVEQSSSAATLQEAVVRIEQTLDMQPPRPEDELRLRLLYLAAGMNDKLKKPVEGMDPIQSELLGAVVETVAASRQAMLEPYDATANALTAADELRRILGQQSGVIIPRIVLVTKVYSYGDYEVINPPRFKAGSEIHAYVYTEVANFRCEPIDEDRLRTLLGQRVQIFDAAGQVVWERHEDNIEDRVRTPRRDFFIPFPVRLPATLPPGDYVLKVTVEDHIGDTTDQQRLSFSIQ